MFQELFFFFKIPTSTRKNSFEICRQFENAPLKMFASPALSLLVSLPVGRYLLSIRCITVMHSSDQTTQKKRKRNRIEINSHASDTTAL